MVQSITVAGGGVAGDDTPFHMCRRVGFNSASCQGSARTHLFDRRASGANENPWAQPDNQVNPNAACNKDGALQFPGVVMSRNHTSEDIQPESIKGHDKTKQHTHSGAIWYPLVATSHLLDCLAPGLEEGWYFIWSVYMALNVQADETALELFRRANRKPLRTGLAFFDEVCTDSMFHPAASACSAQFKFKLHNGQQQQ